MQERHEHILVFLIACTTLANGDIIVIAIKLLNQLAPYFEKDLTESKILPIFTSLSTSRKAKVKCAVAKNLLDISQVVSSTCFTSEVLPIYLKLARDSVWRVRKA